MNKDLKQLAGYIPAGATATKEALARLEAELQALADVRTLDEWAERYGYDTPAPKPYRGGFVVMMQHPRKPVEAAQGPTPDAARHAAAEWVRSQR